MRELKFRAWDTGAKRWTSGVMPVLTGLSLELNPAHSGIIIEQYTGLKDKNGKEICEGDIVQCGAYKGKVHYSVGVACYCVGDYTPIYQISRIENESFITLKVIGNIHENPELLKEK